MDTSLKSKHGDPCESIRLDGNELFKHQKYELAIEKYTQALELNPECHKSLSNRCQCYIVLKNAEKAIQDSEQVVKLKEDWAKGWYRLGASYYLAKQLQKASNAYLKAYELDNSLHEAKRKHNFIQFELNLPDSIRNLIEQNNYQNLEQLVPLLSQQDLEKLAGAAQQRISDTSDISDNPEERIKQVSDLPRTSEVWLISWSTTPQVSEQNERYYQMVIANQHGFRLAVSLCKGEPNASDVIEILENAMWNPMDFGVSRKPECVGFAYRMKGIFDQGKTFLTQLEIESLLEPLEEAKSLAAETGNHYLGLNHLVHA